MDLFDGVSDSRANILGLHLHQAAFNTIGVNHNICGSSTT